MEYINEFTITGIVSKAFSTSITTSNGGSFEEYHVLIEHDAYGRLVSTDITFRENTGLKAGDEVSIKGYIASNRAKDKEVWFTKATGTNIKILTRHKEQEPINAPLSYGDDTGNRCLADADEDTPF